MATPDDNILGGQDAVIRVGVEADMSEILEQAGKFNDLIKDANDSFNVMQTVISSTTSRMAALNSATLRLVSSARQLRNEYQLIADSSQRIAPVNVGGGATADAVAGIGGGDLADLINRGMISPTMSEGGLIVPGGTNSMSAGGTSGGVQVGSESLLKPERFGFGSGGKMLSGALSSLFGKGNSNPGLVNILSNFATGLPGALGAAVPVIGTVVGAALAGYKAVDYMIKGATRYTGLTGGTGVTTSPAGFGGSFIGLQASQWASGLTNMAVGPGGFGEIQEGLLAAGYQPYNYKDYTNSNIRGMRYGVARDTLAALYAKGFQDVGANVELMQTAIESAGSTTGAFVSSMDALRVAAQRSNASIAGLTKAFTTMIKSVSQGMGGQGPWTTFFASTAATAYSNSQNAILRNGGAVVDLSPLTTQIQLINTPAFQAAGINLQNRYMAYSSSPNMAQTMALGQDQAIDQLLGSMGFMGLRGRSWDEIDRSLRTMSSTQIDVLRQSALMQGLVSPEVANDVNAFIEFLVANVSGDPMSNEFNRKKAEAGANPIKNFLGAYSYFDNNIENQQSQSRRNADAFLKLDNKSGKEAMEKYPVLAAYYDYMQDTQKSIGWLDTILQGGDSGKTWVKYRGDIMKLSDFMRENSQNIDARQLMESGELQIATSKKGEKPYEGAFQAAYELGATEKTMQNMTQTELQTTFTEGMKGWSNYNNGAGQALKVDTEGALGLFG